MREHIKAKGIWKFYLDDALIAQEENLIVDDGLEFLAALLANSVTATACYIAWGTGVVATAAGDTKLGTESGRKILATQNSAGKVTSLRIFLLPSEGNGTWTEWGFFVNGTTAADSGILFNRILPGGGITKTSANALTVEVEVTFAAA